MRRALIAVAAGLALADASVVTLALPPLLRDLDTSIEGVAGVLAVYTAVLAVGLLPAAAAARRRGPRTVGAAGAGVLAAASVGCGAAGSLGVLLTFRALQAAGAAALLPAAYALLAGGERGRRLWTGAAVLGTAAGPALGGALTQAFDWRAIFLVQAPIAALAAWACATAPRPPAPAPRERLLPRPAAALALLAAALTAVLFLLVLLLVAGWNLTPLGAAAVVSVLPLAAIAAHRAAPAGAPWRAPVGCALAGAGTLCLAFLPAASAWWTVAPQLLAGAGMGLALPALGGAAAAPSLAVRHAGITLALVALAPIASASFDAAEQRAKERGVALVLDSPLPPLDKLTLAPGLLAGVDTAEPRAGLRRAVRARVAAADGEERDQLAALGRRLDDTLVTAIGESFRTALLIAGALALVGALLVAERPRRAAPALAVAGALALPLAYAGAFALWAPTPPAIADPCHPRPPPPAGGLQGVLQSAGFRLLDRAACRYRSSREELVLALADDKEAARFRARHGADPRSLMETLTRLLGI